MVTLKIGEAEPQSCQALGVNVPSISLTSGQIDTAELHWLKRSLPPEEDTQVTIYRDGVALLSGRVGPVTTSCGATKERSQTLRGPWAALADCDWHMRLPTSRYPSSPANTRFDWRCLQMYAEAWLADDLTLASAEDIPLIIYNDAVDSVLGAKRCSNIADAVAAKYLRGVLRWDYTAVPPQLSIVHEGSADYKAVPAAVIESSLTLRTDTVPRSIGYMLQTADADLVPAAADGGPGYFYRTPVNAAWPIWSLDSLYPDAITGPRVWPRGAPEGGRRHIRLVSSIHDIMRPDSPHWRPLQDKAVYETMQQPDWEGSMTLSLADGLTWRIGDRLLLGAGGVAVVSGLEHDLMARRTTLSLGSGLTVDDVDQRMADIGRHNAIHRALYKRGFWGFNNVFNGPLSIPTTPLKTGIAGHAYAHRLVHTGGQLPVRWSIVSGTLPGTLVMDETGLISGELPSAAGNHAVTFKVIDSTQTGEATQALTLSIVSSPPPGTVWQLPNATIGQPYIEQLLAPSGYVEQTWTRLAGHLPPGLTLSARGLLSGTPSSTGVSTFVAELSAQTTPHLPLFRLQVV